MSLILLIAVIILSIKHYPYWDRGEELKKLDSLKVELDSLQRKRNLLKKLLDYTVSELASVQLKHDDYVAGLQKKDALIIIEYTEGNKKIEGHLAIMKSDTIPPDIRKELLEELLSQQNL